MKCLKQEDLLGYVAGTISSERHSAIEEHFSGCRNCAQARDELITMTRRLAPDPGEFKDPAFADNVLTLLRLGRARPITEAVHNKWLWWFAPAASALAALLMVVFLLQTSTGQNDFQTRGIKENPDRWVSLKVFRSTADGYKLADKSILFGDSLAFTYENRSAEYGFLMVFAVDSGGEVHWYYPAFTSEEQDPESIAIQSGLGQVQLPDEVRHDFSPGPVRLFAVFSKSPLRVKAMEEKVARDLRAAGSNISLDRLSLSGSGQQSMLFAVEPAK